MTLCVTMVGSAIRAHVRIWDRGSRFRTQSAQALTA
jgi:hypothetical protein